jgi:X-X-X-Leu-X-X-Gly heptad repeat protein
MLKFLSGKKTYIVAGIAFVLAVCEATGVFSMPPEGWQVLAAIGLGTLRSGVKKIEAGLEEAASAGREQ